MRNTKEINEEISKLKALKPRCLRESMFGDNHHDAIDAQIAVLEAEGTIDQCDIDHKLDDEEWAGNVAASAREALEWLEGDSEDAPSKDWEDSIKKWN